MTITEMLLQHRMRLAEIEALKPKEIKELEEAKASPQKIDEVILAMPKAEQDRIYGEYEKYADALIIELEKGKILTKHNNAEGFIIIVTVLVVIYFIKNYLH